MPLLKLLTSTFVVLALTLTGAAAEGAKRLLKEASPYLRQHADNPVNWYPWGPEALAKAKAENKPIYLSVGYSTCHWCHVMAHESFADVESAKLMNEHFINIKVDREERPDLDKVYQVAHHLLTQQQGGWPLTMFLDPDSLIPFFGGTYFPKTARHQLPGFRDLLLRVHDVFEQKRDELSEQGAKLQKILTHLSSGVNGNPDDEEAPTGANLEDRELIDTASRHLMQQYDSQHGGFGNAPKFPMPATVQRLLHHWAYAGQRGQQGDGERGQLDAVMTTLTRMARGGIFDHLGGGFCRYSVDARWMIPHFEKMLYDNGQLLSLYADALRIGPDELFSDALRETADWMLRELRAPGGAFYSSLDADSEGEEGKYYVWRREQVKRALTEDEYLVIETLYGLDKPANFENYWNLHRYDSWRSVVQRLSLQRPDADDMLAAAKKKLFALREERVRPGMDDKILTAWNGLAIQGLVNAAAVANEPKWLAAAQGAANFILENCWQNDTLFATWKDTARFPGYLDDYANFLAGLLSLLEAQWEERYVAVAVQLADALLKQFYDVDQGGFYFTSHEHESLIHRPKPTMDDALPPGNGVAANALARLGHLLGRTDYLDAAYGTLTWARTAMEQYPPGHCSLLQALEEQLQGGTQIVLRGPLEAMAPWVTEVSGGLKPWQACYAIPYAGSRTLPGYLPGLVSADEQNRVTAYVCHGLQCSLPIRDLAELKHAL